MVNERRADDCVSAARLINDKARRMPNEPQRQQLNCMNDVELLEREFNDRIEFMQLERNEPESSGTTFREIRASPALLDAWQRWAQSGLAARLRGLLPRGRHRA